MTIKLHVTYIYIGNLRMQIFSSVHDINVTGSQKCPELWALLILGIQYLRIYF